MTTMQKQFRKLSTAYEKNESAEGVDRTNTLFRTWWKDYGNTPYSWNTSGENILSLSKKDFIRLCCMVSKYRPIQLHVFLLHISMIHDAEEFILNSNQTTT